MLSEATNETWMKRSLKGSTYFRRKIRLRNWDSRKIYSWRPKPWIKGFVAVVIHIFKQIKCVGQRVFEYFGQVGYPTALVQKSKRGETRPIPFAKTKKQQQHRQNVLGEKVVDVDGKSDNSLLFCLLWGREATNIIWTEFVCVCACVRVYFARHLNV